MSFARDLFAFTFFRGSKPRHDNIAEPLPRRVGGRAFAVINIGTRSVRVARAQFRRGRLVVDNVQVFKIELNDRELGDSLTPEIITAIRERTGKGLVVAGLSTRVVVKTVDHDARMIERVNELSGGANEDDSERETYLWQESGTKMIRMSIPTAAVRSVERALADEKLTLHRILFTSHVLLNGYLSFCDSIPAPDRDVVRLLTILDDGHIQALTSDRSTGLWKQVRAIPVFSVRSPDGVAPGRTHSVDLLRDFVRSLHREVKPTGVLELAVLNTGLPAEGWSCLEEAVSQLTHSKDVTTPVKLTKVLEAPNIDLHAICLHP